MNEHNRLLSFSEGEKLMPQEEILELDQKKSKIVIGIPKEDSYQECRIPLVPKSIGLLVANGHRIIIEKGAGDLAQFEDQEYAEAGAEIVKNREEVFKADIIIKVAPPSIEELDLINSRQTLISSIHIAGQSREYFEKLISKRMTALAYEYIKDKAKSFPLIRSMSEIVGATSILIANEYLRNPEYGKGILLGGFPGITPSEVVILGAGTVAEYAARAAIGLGATVKIFDNSIYKLRRIQNALGARVFTSIIQPEVLLKSLKTAHVAIGAIHSSEGMCPTVVSEEMVSQMKKGAVIIDISIDQGGCFETSRVTTHNKPVFKKYDVTHYGVPNIASRVPHTASYALSNYFTPLLLNVGEIGGIENMIKVDYGLRQGAYLFNGTLTKAYIGEYYTLPYQNIELLIAAMR
jgi:alanine dehydrogenase